MMRLLQRIALLSIVLATLAVGGLLTTSSAWAEAVANIETVDATGTVVKCEDLTPESHGAALIGKVVPCMIRTIEAATVNFADQMVTELEPLFYAFLTLVIVLFGAQVLQGEPEIHKQGFVLLIKITIVAVILADLGNVRAYDGSGATGKLIPSVYSIMMDTQTMVTGTIDTTTLHCDVANFEGPSTPKVWAIMDCVMGKLYGFTTGAANPDGSKQVNMVLASSVFGLLSGFFFGGTWGVVVFFGMISVLVSFFMLLVRTVVTIVNSYLVICLFLILLPLFLPLLLLKATASYFDAVWRNIMAAFLGPVIITAYTMMAIIIYDKLLFDPGDPAATPPRPAAIIQTLFDNAKVKEALAADRKPFSRPVTGEMPTGRISNNPAQNYWVTDPLLPSLSAANDFGSMLPKIPTLHIEDIDDPEYKKGKETIEKLFMDLLKLFILSWLILQGAKWLPSIVAQIVGKRIATMAADKSMEGPEKVKMTLATAADTAENAFRKAGNPTGAGFLRSIPDASKDSLAAFKNMMSKR